MPEFEKNFCWLQLGIGFQCVNYNTFSRYSLICGTLERHYNTVLGTNSEITVIILLILCKLNSVKMKV